MGLIWEKRGGRRKGERRDSLLGARWLAPSTRREGRTEVMKRGKAGRWWGDDGDGDEVGKAGGRKGGVTGEEQKGSGGESRVKARRERGTFALGTARGTLRGGLGKRREDVRVSRLAWLNLISVASAEAEARVCGCEMELRRYRPTVGGSTTASGSQSRFQRATCGRRPKGEGTAAEASGRRSRSHRLEASGSFVRPSVVRRRPP